MRGKRDQAPRLPPRWFIRLARSMHRGLYRVTGGRIGLWRPKGNRWGALRLTTTGRRTGRPRSVIVGYRVRGTEPKKSPAKASTARNSSAKKATAKTTTTKKSAARKSVALDQLE